MTVKPTSYHKKGHETIPDYEPITSEEEEAAESEDCCVCDNPGSTWCNPENPNGAGSLTTSAAAQTIAFWNMK